MKLDWRFLHNHYLQAVCLVWARLDYSPISDIKVMVKVGVYSLARKVHCLARLLYITPWHTRTIQSILNSLESTQATALMLYIHIASSSHVPGTRFHPLGGKSALVKLLAQGYNVTPIATDQTRIRGYCVQIGRRYQMRQHLYKITRYGLDKNDAFFLKQWPWTSTTDPGSSSWHTLRS